MLDNKLYKQLLITTIEGGSNYWIEYIKPKTCNHKDMYDDLVHNGFVLINLGAEYNVVPEDYKQGLLQLQNRYDKIHKRIIEGTYDANDADSWLQMIIFNEILYS